MDTAIFNIKDALDAVDGDPQGCSR